MGRYISTQNTSCSAGLPQHHIKYVQHIRPGMCLFLFNYSGRMLHGIYEAAGEGALNIDATAWTDNKGRTPFPAQVLHFSSVCRVCVITPLLMLPVPDFEALEF